MFPRRCLQNAVLVNNDLHIQQSHLIRGASDPIYKTQALLQQNTSVSTLPYNNQQTYLATSSLNQLTTSSAVWDHYQRQLQNFQQAAQQAFDYNQYITSAQQQYVYQPTYLAYNYNSIAYSPQIQHVPLEYCTFRSTTSLLDKTSPEIPRPCSADSGICTEIDTESCDVDSKAQNHEREVELSGTKSVQNLEVLRQAILKDIGIKVTGDSLNPSNVKSDLQNIPSTCHVTSEKETQVTDSLVQENSKLLETPSQQCQGEDKTVVSVESECVDLTEESSKVVEKECFPVQKDIQTNSEHLTVHNDHRSEVKTPSVLVTDTVSDRTSTDDKEGGLSTKTSVPEDSQLVISETGRFCPQLNTKSDNHLSLLGISKEISPKDSNSKRLNINDPVSADGGLLTDQVVAGLNSVMYPNRYFQWKNNGPQGQHQKREYHQMPYNSRRGSVPPLPEERYSRGKRRSNTGEDGGGKRPRDPAWGSGASSSSLGSQVSQPPQSFSPNAQLNDGILSHFVQNHQTPDMFRKKLELRDALHNILQGAFKDCGLYIVGSSMTGFATKTSDMDICLMISDVDIVKTEAIQVLSLTQRALQRCGFLHSILLIRAAVPILRFRDMVSNVECDMNINNFVGIYNTHLLKYYSTADWRLRPLVLFLKKWARFHDINDAAKKTLSSYTLSLLCIHFLQCGCEPCVLPSLQKIHPDIFNGGEIRNLRLDERLMYHSENNQQLGDLLLGFLNYYANKFDFDSSVVSVRLGTKIPFHMTKMYHENKANRDKMCLKVEEPFELTNTARSCYDPYTFERVKRVIRVSYRELSKTRRLDSLFKHPF